MDESMKLICVVIFISIILSSYVLAVPDGFNPYYGAASKLTDSNPKAKSGARIARPATQPRDAAIQTARTADTDRPDVPSSI